MNECMDVYMYICIYVYKYCYLFCFCLVFLAHLLGEAIPHNCKRKTPSLYSQPRRYLSRQQLSKYSRLIPRGIPLDPYTSVRSHRFRRTPSLRNICRFLGNICHCIPASLKCVTHSRTYKLLCPQRDWILSLNTSKVKNKHIRREQQRKTRKRIILQRG